MEKKQYYQQLGNYATRQFTNVTMLSGLEDVVSHKSTQYQKVCVYFNLSVYIRRDVSTLVATENVGGQFFSEAFLHREYSRTL